MKTLLLSAIIGSFSGTAIMEASHIAPPVEVDCESQVVCQVMFMISGNWGAGVGTSDHGECVCSDGGDCLTKHCKVSLTVTTTGISRYRYTGTGPCTNAQASKTLAVKNCGKLDALIIQTFAQPGCAGTGVWMHYKAECGDGNCGKGECP
jgi:hypothetical protein